MVGRDACMGETTHISLTLRCKRHPMSCRMSNIVCITCGNLCSVRRTNYWPHSYQINLFSKRKILHIKIKKICRAAVKRRACGDQNHIIYFTSPNPYCQIRWDSLDLSRICHILHICNEYLPIPDFGGW